jgi:transcriptional regulator with GAF, ATPase, and Fis domain
MIPAVPMPRGSDEIVGRGEELSALEHVLASAAEGPVEALLEGEAGIGKTTVWGEGGGARSRRPGKPASLRRASARIV